MIIRRAKECDIPGIDTLLAQVCLVHHKGRPDLFKYGKRKYTAEELKELLLDNTRPVFVAVDDAGEVLAHAFCIYQQYLNNNVLTDIPTLYIDDICVLETCRGQHIGRQMYDYVYNFAKEQGFYNITLNVWSLNEPAMKFYESCGLKPQKIGMEMLISPEAVIPNHK